MSHDYDEYHWCRRCGAALEEVANGDEPPKCEAHDEVASFRYWHRRRLSEELVRGMMQTLRESAMEGR